MAVGNSVWAKSQILRFVLSRLHSRLVSSPVSTLVSSPLPSPLLPRPLCLSHLLSCRLVSCRLVSSDVSSRLDSTLVLSLPPAVSSCLRTRAVGVSREQQQRQEAARSRGFEPCRVRSRGLHTCARQGKETTSEVKSRTAWFLVPFLIAV